MIMGNNLADYFRAKRLVLWILKKKEELCPQSFVELISDCTSVQVLVVLTAFHHHPLSYMLYEFPLLSHCLGLVISVLPIVPVPAYAVWSVWKKEGSIKNVSLWVQCSRRPFSICHILRCLNKITWMD